VKKEDADLCVKKKDEGEMVTEWEERLIYWKEEKNCCTTVT